MIITKGFTDGTIITKGFGLSAIIEFSKREYVKLKSIVNKIIKLGSKVCN